MLLDSYIRVVKRWDEALGCVPDRIRCVPVYGCIPVSWLIGATDERFIGRFGSWNVIEEKIRIGAIRWRAVSSTTPAKRLVKTHIVRKLRILECSEPVQESSAHESGTPLYPRHRVESENLICFKLKLSRKHGRDTSDT